MVVLSARDNTARDLSGWGLGGMRWNMSSYEQTIVALREAIKLRYKSVAGLADAMGIPANRLTRWFSGERGPRYKELAEVFDFMGIKLVFPGESHDTTKDVCFVSPHIVGVNGDAPPIPPENYMAVPLARGSVAAGPGLVPQDAVKGWVLALRSHSSIKYRTNLVAVEIGDGQESMVPTLHPKDIVLVDKDDIRPQPDGSIFLIREPGHDADVAVKRVYTQNQEGETVLNFVSDNPDKRSYPPRVYSLERDYDGDLRRAIVGRVVWSWSDMTRK